MCPNSIVTCSPPLSTAFARAIDETPSTNTTSISRQLIFFILSLLVDPPGIYVYHNGTFTYFSEGPRNPCFCRYGIGEIVRFHLPVSGNLRQLFCRRDSHGQVITVDLDG